MKNKLHKLQELAQGEIFNCKDIDILRKLEIKYLGRKGELTQILRGLSDLSIKEKKEIGPLANEVKMAEARWRNLLENVQLMVVGVDHDKSIFYVNPFFLDATGYLKSEVLNHPLLNILPEPSSSGDSSSRE